jgi:hypothetical protein
MQGLSEENHVRRADIYENFIPWLEEDTLDSNLIFSDEITFQRNKMCLSEGASVQSVHHDLPKVNVLCAYSKDNCTVPSSQNKPLLA